MSIPLALSVLNSEGLVAGRTMALVVTLGRSAGGTPLGAAELGNVELSDGTMLEIALFDGSGTDARRLGSGIVQYFNASGGRLELACLIPVRDVLDAVLDVRKFDSARAFMGTIPIAAVAMGAIPVGAAPMERSSLGLAAVLPPTQPVDLLAGTRSYDLYISASGKGFELHRSVLGVDYRRETVPFAISDEFLSNALDAKKIQLDTESRSYTASITKADPTDPLHLVEERARSHCFRIAQLGREIYDEILWKDLPPDAPNARAVFWKEIERLPAGVQLRIHNDGMVIPWNIVYDRDLPARARDFTVDHIQGFWGYRYRIEESLDLHATRRIRGSVVPRRLLCAYVDPTLGDSDTRVSGVPNEHRMLFDSAPMRACKVAVLPTDVAALVAGQGDPLADLERVIGPPDPMHLLYFLCHATSSRTFNREGARLSRRGALQLTNAHAITDQNIQQWAKKWADEFKAEPIVFLNCCEAAGMDPFGFGGLVEGFLTYLLATAVVGCSWEVPTHFAHGFAQRFFAEFLTEPPKSLGDALFDLRRDLLEQLNPFGLIYAVYGNAGVKLAPLA